MAEISVNCYGLSTMCRLCLRRGVKLFDIFHFSNKIKNKVADIIMTCAPVQITKSDEMPNVICQLCYNQVEKIRRFQIQVLESDKTLRRYLLKLNSYGRQTSRESSLERLTENPLNYISDDVAVNCESLENQINWDKKSRVNFNSSINIINEIFPKSEIKEETTIGNSQFLTDCVDDTVETFFECDGGENSWEDSKMEICGTKVGFGLDIPVKCDSPKLQGMFDMDVNWEQKSPVNFGSENKINNEISLQSKIKEEMTDDNSLFPTDSKMEICDTKVGFEMGINLKETANAVLVSTNAINEGISLKFEIKHEPMNDNSSILTECINDTVNASSHDDACKISCEDIETDYGHTSAGDTVKTSFKNDGKRIHHRETRNQCNVCYKHFTRFAYLNIHKRIHTGDKLYKCDVCNKHFTQVSHLNRHKRIHTGEKPYKCDVCNKHFKSPGCLTKHRRVHTGEKPFKCNVCNKNFAQAGHLNSHKRTHTGEKPYKCDVCNKCFTESSSLKTHKRIHTGEKPYKCDVCKKQFTERNSLNRHNRIHTSAKPYQCDICSKCFDRLEKLNTHKLKHT